MDFSRAPNINICAPWPLTLIRPLTWPRPDPTQTLTLTLQQVNSDARTWFLAFDFDLTLTYNPNLAEVKVKNILNIKVIGQTVQPWECWPMNGRRDATKSIIPCFTKLRSRWKYILMHFNVNHVVRVNRLRPAGVGKLDAWTLQIFLFPPTKLYENDRSPLCEYPENLGSSPHNSWPRIGINRDENCV